MSLHKSLYTVKSGNRILYRGKTSNEALAAVIRLTPILKHVHMVPEVQNGSTQNNVSA